MTYIRGFRIYVLKCYWSCVTHDLIKILFFSMCILHIYNTIREARLNHWHAEVPFNRIMTNDTFVDQVRTGEGYIWNCVPIDLTSYLFLNTEAENYVDGVLKYENEKIQISTDYLAPNNMLIEKYILCRTPLIKLSLTPTSNPTPSQFIDRD